jgi:hypothetical protein
MIGDQIDFTAEQILKILPQANQIEDGGAVTESGNEINIAGGRCLITRDATKDAYVIGTMLLGKSQDLVSP